MSARKCTSRLTLRVTLSILFQTIMFEKCMNGVLFPSKQTNVDIYVIKNIQSINENRKIIHVHVGMKNRCMAVGKDLVQSWDFMKGKYYATISLHVILVYSDIL